MKIIEYALPEIDQVVLKMQQDLSECSIVTMTGSLGSGKTTLCGALLRRLGVKGPVISPTFTYVNMYQGSAGLTIYHFDLYRLKNMQEFEQAGFFEYLYQPNSLVIIEWPEIILPFLKGDICHINLSSLGQLQRKLMYEVKK